MEKALNEEKMLEMGSFAYFSFKDPTSNFKK